MMTSLRVLAVLVAAAIVGLALSGQTIISALDVVDMVPAGVLTVAAILPSRTWALRGMFLGHCCAIGLSGSVLLFQPLLGGINQAYPWVVLALVAATGGAVGAGAGLVRDRLRILAR